MSNAEIQTYARELAGMLGEIMSLQAQAKDIVASAKEAGINVTALRRVAREMNMEADKRKKIYDDEDQADLFRSECGLFKTAGELTRDYGEAAE